MREISQWEIYQQYNQQVFAEVSRAQACAGRGRILVTKVPGLGGISFCLDDEDTLTQNCRSLCALSRGERGYEMFLAGGRTHSGL